MLARTCTRLLGGFVGASKSLGVSPSKLVSWSSGFLPPKVADYVTKPNQTGAD